MKGERKKYTQADERGEGECEREREERREGR